MKNNFLKLLMFLLFFSVLYVNNTVKAEGTEESCNDFVNSQGIFISTEDCQRLKSLGYSVDYINTMNLEEYNLNNGISGEMIKTEVKYYKTIYYQQNSLNDLTSGNESEIIELSEKEFYEQLEMENKLDNLMENKFIKPFGTETNYAETTYKKLKVEIVKLSTGKYRAYVDLDWKKIPKTREDDILGASIRFPDYFILDHSNRFGRQSWSAKGCPSAYVPDCVGSKTMHGNIYYYNNSSKWLDSSYEGMGIAMNLKNDFKEDYYDYRLNRLVLHSWFNFELNRSYPYYNVEIMGAYRHKVKKSPITLSEISLTWGAPTIKFNINSESSHYDGELKTRVYIPK